MLFKLFCPCIGRYPITARSVCTYVISLTTYLSMHVKCFCMFLDVLFVPSPDEMNYLYLSLEHTTIAYLKL